VTGPQPRRRGPGWPGAALDHDGALAAADQVFVTAHPAEPATFVLLRAAEAALTSYVDSARETGTDGAAAGDPLRRLLARHLTERLPDDPAAALWVAVTVAAVVAALDLALAEWQADGGRDDRACRRRLLAVAPLLPQEP
jgi:hypothetical protein